MSFGVHVSVERHFKVLLQSQSSPTLSKSSDNVSTCSGIASYIGNLSPTKCQPTKTTGYGDYCNDYFGNGDGLSNTNQYASSHLYISIPWTCGASQTKKEHTLSLRTLFPCYDKSNVSLAIMVSYTLIGQWKIFRFTSALSLTSFYLWNSFPTEDSFLHF